MSEVEKLFVERIQRWTAQLSYKPSWKFTAYEEPNLGVTISVRFLAPDSCSDDPLMTTVVGFEDTITAAWWAERSLKEQFDYFMLTIQNLLRMSDAHERQEWLKIDGAHVVKPHQPCLGALNNHLK